MALACSRREPRPLGRQQGFLLTTGIWVVFPLFGALPFWFGAPHASFTDALFEAMSAITTTGLDGVRRPRASCPPARCSGAACCNGSAASASWWWR